MTDVKTLSTEDLLAENDRLKSLISSKNTLQEAIKVTLNSLYGALGNRFFRFYDIRLAEGITRTGRMIILSLEKACNKWISDKIGEDKDWCIAIDTDSLYLSLDPLRKKIVGDKTLSVERTTDLIDAICSKIQEEAINPALESMALYLNCPNHTMAMKREAIASGGFWVAAKKYAIDVIDMEGVRYATPELKVTGLDVIKSSTPKFCRESLELALELIIRGDSDDRIVEFIQTVKDQFKDLPLIEMSRPGSINQLDKYRGPKGEPIKGTPYNSRCALIYNKAIGPGSGLEAKYRPIKPGDKVRFIALRLPNPFYSDAIAVPDLIPPELNLEEWADRNRMFADYFVKPLELICDRISVRHTVKPALQNFWDY
jgi:DNA polymerase elongation subunit (family B)